MMQKINSGFIGDFKLGDNVVYNLSILKCLYDIYTESNNENKKLLIKPIVLTNLSIIEAVLFDFRYRVVNHNKEGIKKLSDKQIKSIKDGKKDVFDKLIEMARKENIFNQIPLFYEILDDLRKVRNRIHIQNIRKHNPVDEYNVFTDKVLKDSSIYLEYILKYMEKEYIRSSDKKFVQDFSLPWKNKIPDGYI